jgi:ribosomal protein S6
LEEILKKYDLNVLIDVSKGEEEAKSVQTKLTDIITSDGGTIYTNSGVKKIKLARTFKRHTQAYSLRLQYTANSTILSNLHREFVINERIIRHMNARLESVFSESAIAELVK